jgi:hypothetical protein
MFSPAKKKHKYMFSKLGVFQTIQLFTARQPTKLPNDEIWNSSFPCTAPFPAQRLFLHSQPASHSPNKQALSLTAHSSSYILPREHILSPSSKISSSHGDQGSLTLIKSDDVDVAPLHMVGINPRDEDGAVESDGGSANRARAATGRVHHIRELPRARLVSVDLQVPPSVFVFLQYQDL